MRVSDKLELNQKEQQALDAIKSIAVNQIAPSHDKQYEIQCKCSRTSVYSLIKSLLKKGYIERYAQGKLRYLSDDEILEKLCDEDKKEQAVEKLVKEKPKVVDTKETEPEVFMVATEKQKPEVIVIDDSTSIKHLIALYRKRINHFMQREEEEGIRELYFWLKTRNIDGFDYIKEAIPVFAHKHESKRTFGYFVRLVRHWAFNGKYAMPTQEDTQLLDIFKTLSGIEPSDPAREIMVKLIGEYGVIKFTYIMTTVLSKKVDFDLSRMLMESVEDKLKETKREEG